MVKSNIFQQYDLAGLRPPGMLTIAITGACNLTCNHCWVKAGAASSHTNAPLQAIQQLLEEFAALGGENIRITGGEPLCHPHWPDILQSCRSLEFKTVILQTNAMLLTDEHLTTLRKIIFPGFMIHVSLDGVKTATHDLVRGEGAFNAARQGIMKLVQSGFAKQISLFLTEMRHNIAEIPELLDFADRTGISSVSTGTIVNCGRAAETDLVAAPDTRQYLNLLERYNSDSHFRGLYSKIGTVAAIEWLTNNTARQNCCTFIENPYITPSGRIYPCLLCHTDDFSVSSVFEKGLAAALLEGIPVWSALLRTSRDRADKIPECLECHWKALCAGGCMGRAWGSCGNLMVTDDRCETRKAVYLQRRESGRQ